MSDIKFQLSVYHIGGRSGTWQFPQLPEKYQSRLKIVLFDADADCVDQARQVDSNVRVLPYCIVGSDQKVKFYLTADRYESSIIKPEPDSTVAYYDFGWDHDMKGVVDEEIEVDAVSLETMLAKEPDLSAPDFLSLDTEGTEPDILSGAKKYLQSDMLAFQTEFHIVDTFPSIYKLAGDYGFELVETEMAKSGWQTHNEIPIGLRYHEPCGRFHGELVFFKSPDAIVQNHKNVELALIKAAFIAFSMKRVDLMYKYLDKYKEMDSRYDFLQNNKGKEPYLLFILGVLVVADGYPQIYPFRFSELFPGSVDRCNRFTKDLKVDVLKAREKYFERVDKEMFKENYTTLTSPENVGIEALFAQEGFVEVANQMRNDRLAGIAKMLQICGAIENGGTDEVKINCQKVNEF